MSQIYVTICLLSLSLSLAGFHPQMLLPASFSDLPSGGERFFLPLPSSFLEQFSSSFKWSGRDVGRGILITYINICIQAG